MTFIFQTYIWFLNWFSYVKSNGISPITKWIPRCIVASITIRILNKTSNIYPNRISLIYWQSYNWVSLYITYSSLHVNISHFHQAKHLIQLFTCNISISFQIFPFTTYLCLLHSTWYTYLIWSTKIALQSNKNRLTFKVIAIFIYISSLHLLLLCTTF